MTELREDEIEALLKFDGARLDVVHRDDLLKTVEPYTAVITCQGKSLARSAESRILAVRAAWGVYNKFRTTPTYAQRDPEWLYQLVMGDVELRIKHLLEEKRNGNK